MAVVPFRRPGPSAAPQAAPDPGADRRYAVTADGRRVAYVGAGSGPDVVLIHGTLMTADDMRLGPMDALARDFRCTAFDRPGPRVE